MPYSRLKMANDNPNVTTKKKIREALSLIKKGWQKNEIEEYFEEKYDLTQRAAYDYYHDALVLLEQNHPLEEFAQQVRDEQIARVTDIYKTALERNNLGIALKAADMLNKINGLYKDEHDIRLLGDMIRFKFDDDK